MDIYRIGGGKVVEHWGLTDQVAMLQQLGVMPPPRGNA
jgi:predicted ester cyclase